MNQPNVFPEAPAAEGREPGPSSQNPRPQVTAESEPGAPSSQNPRPQVTAESEPGAPSSQNPRPVATSESEPSPSSQNPRGRGSSENKAQLLEMAIGALNGVIGDYLERTGNGLATPMSAVRDGALLALTRESLTRACPPSPTRVVVLVHGLMSTEDVFRMPDGETYGSLLERDLGFAALSVRYNSGRRISESGASLDALLEQLVAAWPAEIEELSLIGHSMGGLVIRSATHAAAERQSAWLPLVKRAFYLGAPHLGAPLERFGNAVSWALRKVGHPVSMLIADIVNLRSAGVKDLRYGNLRREDWEGRDADELLTNRRHPVPLLPHIRHHLVVGSLSSDVESAILLGDVLVPVRSAAGRAKADDRCSPFPQEHVRVMPGYHHVRLAHDPEIYALIRAWCEERETPAEEQP